MSKEQTITINGVAYDTATGMRLEPAQQVPIKKAATESTKAPTSHHLHQRTAKTATLNRAHVKAPAAHVAAKSKAPVQQIRRSPMVRKFADISPAKTAVVPKPSHPSTPADIAPIQHPLQVVAAKRQHPTRHSTPQPRPASEIKRQAIEKALRTAKSSQAPKTKRRSFLKRHPRATSIASASLALVLLAGYLTYINLPSISVRVAAAQAGIAATYPSYQPSGYSLHGPVAYSNGQVSMKFAANVGTQNFTVNQIKSSWDSSALLDNYVEPESNGDYMTYNDNGLTIYVYNTDAAWVNGGILHTIKGDAPLTNDQIRKIATSI